MDLSEFLKLGLKELHKGKINNRVVLNKLNRQTQRNELMFSKRKIGGSPLAITPQPKMSKLPEKPSRLEEMKKWQQERNKRRAEEKSKQKPVFKVSQTYKSKDLNSVYKEIKGKPIATLLANSDQTFQLTHSSHKFKAPANVKAISLKTVTENVSTKDSSTDRITRSHKPTVTENPVEKARKKLLFQKQTTLPSVRQTKQKIEPTSTITSRNTKFETRNTRSRSKVDKGSESITEAARKTKPSKQNTNIEKSQLLKNNTNMKPKPSTIVKAVAEAVPLQSTAADDCRDAISVDANTVVQTLLPMINIPSTTPSPNTKRSPLTRQNKIDEHTPEIDSSDNSKDSSLNTSSVKDLVDKFEESVSLKKTPSKTKTPKKTRRSSINIPKVFENLLEPNGTPNITNNSSFRSPEFPIGMVVKTPPNTTPNDNVYISPFVTMSRGKKTARKEYKSRLSMGGLSVTSPDATSTKAGAAYFYKLMDEEISKIQEICNEWQKYKEDETPPEEACDMINTAIGQSTLLITKKMQQFRGLIDSCAAQDGSPLITCQDLHGFWDLLIIQIDNVNKRFENLVKLRANQWEEIIPEKKKVVAVRPTRKRAPKKPSAATSSIKDAIKAARKAKKQNVLIPEAVDLNSFDGGFFSVKSPRKSLSKTSLKTPVKSASKARKSLLGSVLSSEASRHFSTSPGMAMIKATQVAKAVETDGQISVYGTPGKSILKSVNAKSARKTVFFKEDNIDDFVINTSPTFDTENNLNANNIIQMMSSEKNEPRRRSTRLTRNKLF